MYSFVTGSGVNDNDVMVTASSTELSQCDKHLVFVTAGTATIEVSLDGTNWTAEATFPIAVRLLNATAATTWVTSVAAGQMAELLGRFRGVRLKQSGATASTGQLASFRAAY